MDWKWKSEIESIKQEDDDFTEIHVTVSEDIDFASLHAMLEQNNNEQNQYEDQNLTEIKQESSIIKVENYDDWCMPSAYTSHLNFRHEVPDEEYQVQISSVGSEEDIPLCMLCGKSFPNRYMLYKHNLIHLKVQLKIQKVFRCEHCPRIYKSKRGIKYHIAKQHYWLFVNREKTEKITTLTHRCLLCDKVMTYKAWFSHMDEVHGIKIFECQKCKKLFNGKRYLLRHIQFVHKGVKREACLREPKEKFQIKCPECPAILNSNYALTTHHRNCHSTQKFECELCKSKLKCKAYLNAHMIRVHRNDGRMYKCKQCSKEFKSTRYLRVHEKNSHKVV